MGRIAIWLTMAAVLLIAAPAHAAFPGENGRIAFTRVQPAGASDIYSAEPSGQVQVRLTEDGISANPVFSPDGLRLAYSSGTRIYVADQYANNPQLVIDTGSGVGEIDWSPDGTQLVAAIANCAEFDCESDIYVVNVDGTGLTNLTNSLFSEVNPSWAPDGSKVAYDSAVAGDQDIYTMNPDGSGVQNLTADTPAIAAEPDWKPDGSKIAFERDGVSATMNPDGTGKTTFPGAGPRPAWSPDGTNMAYVGGGFVRVAQPPSEPWNALGSGEEPDWQVRPPQPVPPPGGLGFPRPKGATPLLVPLVPAYAKCPTFSEPNRQHGPPLAYPSCNPPNLSFRLTLGTPDANGNPAEGVGRVRFDTLIGNPTTPEDEADVSLAVSQTDVRTNFASGGYADFTGRFLLVVPLRVSDLFNAGGGADGAGTVADFSLYMVVPCAPTPAEPVGSTCAANTSVDALVPGLVRERERTIWELGQLSLQWEGLDADPNTLNDNRTFLTSGVFVP